MVNSLVTPVTLGVDFLQENGLVLDFSQTSAVVHSGHPVQNPATESNIAVARVVPIYDAANLDCTCVVSVNEEIEKDIVDECAIPSYKSPPKIDHVIPTTGNPVKIPPRRIPAHYRAEVTQQIQTMLEQGIITRSKSPWMTPVVFVPKSLGRSEYVLTTVN